MTSPSALLDVRNLSVSVAGDKLLVRNVSFTLERGRTLALIGESGSGKSLTALSLMGLLPGALQLGAGSTLRFDGAILPAGNDRAMRALRGRRIAIVFQDPMACLNPFMRIGSQIEEALTRLGMRDRAERRRRIEALLEEVELPDPAVLARRYPHELSGGQQQRVMIAMALAGEPDLLIADEPTSSLDASIEAEIVRLLAGLQSRRKMAMLFITHDLSVAAMLAHEIAVMRHGEIVEAGLAGQVLTAPGHPYTQRLVGARSVIRAPAEPRAGIPAPGPLLSVDKLCLDYPARSLLGSPSRVVSDVSLTLEAGHVLGILGESGSGKSTLAAAISGLHRPAAGRVTILGHDLTPVDPRLPMDLRRRCQLVFQNPYGALNPRLSIKRLVAEPLALAGVPPHEHQGRVALALDEVGLGCDHMARYPHQLSGGQRQRVCIARALLCEPSLLVCDEVVSALDTTVQMQVLQLLKRLQAERGFGMVFIGHDVEIVSWMSDEILVMHRGRVVDRFEASAMRSHERHAYTKQLVLVRRELMAA